MDEDCMGLCLHVVSFQQEQVQSILEVSHIELNIE